MCKEDLINLKKDLEKNCISLTKFLINYCGIYSDDMHNIEISHSDIKELMPQLKRVSFESLLKNKNGFYTGNIIPVKDCCGNVVPYINPMLKVDELSQINCEKIKEENEVSLLGGWWDRKSQNEIVIIAINELEKTCHIYEVKRKSEKINLKTLKDKIEVFKENIPNYYVSFSGLSMDDM